MNRKPVRPKGAALRRFAFILWALAGVLAAAQVVCLLFWRDPWVTHTVDADTTDIGTLEGYARGHAPYVSIKNIDLAFTGYYEVDAGQQVCIYWYKGNVGGKDILVDVPAEDGGELIQKKDARESFLKAYSAEGKVSANDEIVKTLADLEGISIQAYRDKYGLSGLQIDVFHNDQERVQIYQLMLIIIIAGLAVSGLIFYAESRRTSEVPQEKDS